MNIKIIAKKMILIKIKDMGNIKNIQLKQEYNGIMS